MRLFFLAVMFLALPVAANDFSARYPAGSIRDAQQAQAALKDADAEMLRIAGSAKSREGQCYRGLLVNSCRDDVRREKELAEREVRRVRVEARDLQRRIDAEDLARRRAEKAEASAIEEAQRLKKRKPARAAIATREAEQRRDAAENAPRDPNSETQGSGERPRPAQEKLSVAERAENARKFQQKQAQAAKRAREREAERSKNEERRAAKRKQIEQREAEREAIRKKAVDLEKKL